MGNIKLDQLCVNWEETLGAPLLAVDMEESFSWASGKRTDQRDGYTLSVLCPKLKFEKVKIKLKVTEQPEIFSKNDEEDGPVSVEFQGLGGKIYQDYTTKEIRMSLFADGVKVADE